MSLLRLLEPSDLPPPAQRPLDVEVAELPPRIVAPPPTAAEACRSTDAAGRARAAPRSRLGHPVEPLPPAGARWRRRPPSPRSRSTRPGRRSRGETPSSCRRPAEPQPVAPSPAIPSSPSVQEGDRASRARPRDSARSRSGTSRRSTGRREHGRTRDLPAAAGDPRGAPPPEHRDHRGRPVQRGGQRQRPGRAHRADRRFRSEPRAARVAQAVAVLSRDAGRKARRIHRRDPDTRSRCGEALTRRIPSSSRAGAPSRTTRRRTRASSGARTRAPSGWPCTSARAGRGSNTRPAARARSSHRRVSLREPARSRSADRARARRRRRGSPAGRVIDAPMGATYTAAA